MTGAEKFKELFEKYKDKREILLYGDPDCDGLMSLLLMCEFCAMMNVPCTYYVNEHRYHGFTYPIKDLKGKMVIAADFAILKEEMQELVDNDVVVLSTDHHDIKYDFVDIVSEITEAEGIIINNQYEFEPEEDKYLSGAGVFYELICSLYPQFKNQVYDAIVGITLLSDIRPTENDKAKKYLRTTYHIDTDSGYIHYLVANTTKQTYNFGAPKIDRNFIDYTLSPTINALLRYNKTKEAIDFILGKGLEHGDTYRTQQQSLISVMEQRAQIMDLSNVVIVAIIDRDFYDYKDIALSDFIGLLCSNFKNKTGGKSVLGFTVENNKVTRASFRGRYDDIPYLTYIKGLGLNANGHQNAFGLREFEPTQDTWILINDLISELEVNHNRQADIIEVNNLSSFVNECGRKVAEYNCYVRDCFRKYIVYKGTNIQVRKETYKMIELTYEDRLLGRTPDYKDKSTKKEYKWELDEQGNRIPKYLEYIVDGRTVKSFGDKIEGNAILPMLEKNYLVLYVKPLPD